MIYFIIFIIMCINVCMFLCSCECSAYREQKKVLDNLMLELQMVVGVGNKTGILVSFPGP